MSEFETALNAQLVQSQQGDRLRAETDDEGNISFENLRHEGGQPESADDPALARVFDMFGFSPDDYEIVGNLRASAWEQRSADGETHVLHSYRGNLRRKAKAELSAEDYARLISVAGSDAKPSPAPGTDATRVVICGDLQAGKADVHGGTAELATRVDSLLSTLGGIAQSAPAGRLLWVDPGDIVEGFSSTISQAHTNDLSFPAQIQTARQTLARMIGVARTWTAETHVMTCTSNHAAWRDGKGYLGRPGDDFGIDIHRAVAEAFELAGFEDTRWHLPDVWKEYTTAIVGGHRYSLTHGHRAKNRNAVMEWWRGQIFADHDQLADTKFFVNGHWHSAFVTQVGDGRWQIQSPAMDGGSNWFTNATGTSSLPGAVTFLVDGEGHVHDLRFIEIVVVQ